MLAHGSARSIGSPGQEIVTRVLAVLGAFVTFWRFGTLRATFTLGKGSPVARGEANSCTCSVLAAGKRRPVIQAGVKFQKTCAGSRDQPVRIKSMYPPRWAWQFNDSG